MLPSVNKLYSHETTFGFTTIPNWIASFSSIFAAICFSALISSSVYPNFFAISSDIFLSSTSLVGVAVIPNTLVSSG